MNCRPWLSISRTIFDINIEALEQKPWRQPGVDITDYFNFDLNEESWRSYCMELVILVDIMLIFFLKLPDHLNESETFFFSFTLGSSRLKCLNHLLLVNHLARIRYNIHSSSVKSFFIFVIFQMFYSMVLKSGTSVCADAN